MPETMNRYGRDGALNICLKASANTKQHLIIDI